MNKAVKGSKFLRDDGTWGRLAYYASDPGDNVLSNEQVLELLVQAGIWGDASRNPATDCSAAFELAESRQVFTEHLLTQRKDCWAIGYYCLGLFDELAFGLTPQRAICLYLLRPFEIQRCVR